MDIPAGLSSYRANLVQKILFKNIPDFISYEEWPPSSPDLNPMDFGIWSLLQERACKKPHKSLKSLKRALQRE